MQIAQGYTRGVAVTPSDSANQDYGFTQKAFYIGGAGAVKVTTANGDTVTFSAVPVGMLYVSAKKVFSTGTTATNIVAVGD